MLTSKMRAELRGQANELETTLMVGKEGVTAAVIEEANTQLTARELVKGKVLETALMTAREASDAICQATGADGVQTVGSKFVIYRKSEQKAKQAAKKQPQKKKAPNPVRKGVQKRRKQAKQAREKRNNYFKQAAIEAAIVRRRGTSDKD